MSDAVALTPDGLRPWPQRVGRLAEAQATGAPDRLDLWLSARWGEWRLHLPGRLHALQKIAAEAMQKAEAIAALPDDEVRERAVALRGVLARPQVPATELALALALVREGAARSLQLAAFPEQLAGAAALLRGMCAEMATGEGKTLTAAIAATCAALAGRPVHVITVNDYLAQRDAAFAAPLLAFFGLTVGCTQQAQDARARRAAYACNVTYCTNKDVVFDHLRDGLAAGTGRSPRRSRVEALLGTGPAPAAPMIPDLAFAIVDEADSVLVDEARTPLIISSEQDRIDPEVYRQALEIAGGLVPERHCIVDAAQRRVDLTEEGREGVAQLVASCRMEGLWRSERAREHLCRQALAALHLYRRDRDYIVQGGKVQIVDEYTGRVLADRSWEKGLHQMVEAKEGVAITPDRVPVARMTYQTFFTRYERLAGMSGTVHEVAGELWAVYGLPVVAIPTHRPVQRKDLGHRVFLDPAERLAALVARCTSMRAEGRPVLVGTRSVAMSEAVADHLAQAGIEARVLNAKQDREEADIVAAAGQRSRVTVATNMAGRGTDIAIEPAVRDAGGLHVILTELHESARIDRQLFGRCARQGDPGSCESMACLEDDLFRNFGSAALLAACRRWIHAAVLPAPLARWLSLRTQRRAQGLLAAQRLQVMRDDRRLQQMMAFAGRGGTT
jgi:preprotein translocase subunit SecA